ncbi:MAG: RNA polymerase sigma factor [Nitrospiraceae bacterium]
MSDRSLSSRADEERSALLDRAGALDRFLASVERRAYRMARIATGDEEEALDLIQDAMLTLVQRYRDKPEAEWGPLFHRIVQSRIRDWYRRTRVRRMWRRWLTSPNADQDDAEDPLEAMPDTERPQPDRAAMQRQAMTALDAALHALPMRQQQAFLLRAWEELDVAETAAAMGCSVGSVKTHYSRAVHTLRKRLAAHDDRAVAGGTDEAP